MDKLKTWFLVIFVGAAIIGSVVSMIGISETEASRAGRTLLMFDCKNVNGACTDTCERTFSCGGNTYVLTGCYRGDSEVCRPPKGAACFQRDARKYLEDRGYCRSWYPGVGYRNDDFTKAIGRGNACRFQVQIRNRDWVILNQGPEPNSQPAWFCNGNSFIRLPGTCKTRAVEFWHNGNDTVPGC